MNAFNLIRQILDNAGRPRPMMVGFTEVQSGGPYSQNGLSQIAGRVMSGGYANNVLAIAIGQTALSNWPEYVGIAYDPASITVTGCGQVLRVGTAWQVFAYTQTTGNVGMPQAQNLNMDHRGLGLVSGTIGGKAYIFGFSHNVYAVNYPALLMQALPQIAADARQAFGQDDAVIVFGGDFNCNPRNRNGAVNLEAYSPIDNGHYIPTTNAHAYDYWLVDDQLLVPEPLICPTTRNVTLGLSDHAAVILQYATP
ncbi:hypothetical protein [Azospirillum sp. HJ39]|uniref:hypothetical protein n=1 Tax=Azospirillum sp. HJ39 TaxID=3159496 RepID=UPI003556DD09